MSVALNFSTSKIVHLNLIQIFRQNLIVFLALQFLVNISDSVFTFDLYFLFRL